VTFVADDTFQKARKDHRCCACGEKIPKGFEYVKSFFVEDGPCADKWHTECRDEFISLLREYGEHEGDPYDTWESGLPMEIKKKYELEVTEEEA